MTYKNKIENNTKRDLETFLNLPPKIIQVVVLNKFCKKKQRGEVQWETVLQSTLEFGLQHT